MDKNPEDDREYTYSAWSGGLVHVSPGLVIFDPVDCPAVDTKTPQSNCPQNGPSHVGDGLQIWDPEI